MGKARKVFSANSHFDQELSLYQDSRYCLFASWDKTLRLWDLESGKSTITFVDNDRDVLYMGHGPWGMNSREWARTPSTDTPAQYRALAMPEEATASPQATKTEVPLEGRQPGTALETRGTQRLFWPGSPAEAVNQVPFSPVKYWNVVTLTTKYWHGTCQRTRSLLDILSTTY